MSVSDAVRTPLLLLAVLAMAGWVATAAAVLGRSASTLSAAVSPVRSQITYATTTLNQISRVGHGLVLHHFAFTTSQTGPATISWYDSDLRPSAPRQVVVVSLYVDGTQVAATIKSDLNSAGADGQGDLIWHGDLPRGRHIAEIRVQETAPWQCPYVDPGVQGVDELIVDSGGTNAT